METAASELLRAFRGRRSQIAFARRLGYRGNPICDWENGRRFPTGAEALRAARVGGVDVDEAFRRFATLEVPAPSAFDDVALAAWLSSLRGSTPIAEVAARAGVTRFVVSRWLGGHTRPRLPYLLRLIDALTRRAAEWVGCLVDITLVPSLERAYRRQVAQRRLAQELPWSEGVLRLLETSAYTELARHDPGWLAERLGLDDDALGRALDALSEVGAIRWDGERWRAGKPLTVDTTGDRAVTAALKGWWLDVARRRVASPRAGDVLSHNVISLSRADLERLRELHLAYFRDVRALVAASEPVEVAALVQVHLVTF